MTKIGRNAPCPCGSGKKYKKCCIDKATPLISAVNRNHQWFLDEIEAFTTEDIVSQLRRFGIPFDEAKFQEDVRHFYSAEELAKSWEKKFTIIASGFDVDFIWMACMVLWKRLAPDVINSEQLDDMMQEGYTLLEAEGLDKSVECCNIWLQVWDHLKSRFTEDMKSIEDAEDVFNGMQFLFNWCQDFEMELLNAGSSDPSFYQKRIDYCREFCSFFPDSSELLIIHMKRAEAESYFMLGETEQGDQAFQALIEEFPDNAWGYIGWGDMYSTFCPRHMEKNLKKAKEIYEMALNIDSDEKEHVISRLKSLDEEETDGSL